MNTIRTILFIVIVVAMFVAIISMAFGLSYGETEKSYKRADVCVYIFMGAWCVMLIAFMGLLYITELNINN